MALAMETATPMTDRAAVPHEEALRQAAAHHSMLKAYILAVVRDYDLAEDSLSDTMVEIARSWASYEPSRPFAPWARGVARRVALANLRRRSAVPVPMDANTLEALGSGLDSLGGAVQIEKRKQALRECLELLSEPHRRLIRLRYAEGRSPSQIAGLVGRTAESLYVTFSRIHENLFRCVRARMENEP